MIQMLRVHHTFVGFALSALVSALGCGGVGTASSGGGATGGEAPQRPDDGTPGASCYKSGMLVCGDYDYENHAMYCNDERKLEDVYTCPGLAPCNPYGSDSITCDAAGSDGAIGLAKTGAPCASSQYVTCSFDRGVVLFCENGVWVEGIHCPPSECGHPSGKLDQIGCTNGGYSVGDKCSFAAGSVNCTTDLTGIVQCASGVTTLFKTCSPGTCTRFADNTIGCQ